MFENKPPSALVNRTYNFLGKDYTAASVLRKPGMPQGYTMGDMANDYATMIRDEFGGPVDVIGISTGGSIIQQFAADHPDLVRRLVIHSSAHTLSDAAKAAQMEVGRLASQRKWREAWAILLLIITIEAEDQFNFKTRLAEITAPTLVVAGERDPFYSAALFRETASGIPNARLILYPGMGHPASGKQFERDVLRFLREE